MADGFYIIELPILSHTKPKQKTSITNHRRRQDNYNGIYYLYGLGCAKWEDCFSCPLKKCTWQSGRAKPDNEEE